MGLFWALLAVAQIRASLPVVEKYGADPEENEAPGARAHLQGGGDRGEECPRSLQAQRAWARGRAELARDDDLQVACLQGLPHGEVQLAVALLLPHQRGHRVPPGGAPPPCPGVPV